MLKSKTDDTMEEKNGFTVILSSNGTLLLDVWLDLLRLLYVKTKLVDSTAFDLHTIVINPIPNVF
jgi:hypothetical protein